MRVNEHTGEIGGHVKGWTCGDVMFALHAGQPHGLPKPPHRAWQIGSPT